VVCVIMTLRECRFLASLSDEWADQGICAQVRGAVVPEDVCGRAARNRGGLSR